MSGLTENEKIAGRKFRADMAARLEIQNDIDPPTYAVPHFLSVYRHMCGGNEGRSAALELKERYWESPHYPEEGVPEGRFGFIYREGSCRTCGQTARSPAGRIVDGWERPPLTGRVTRS